MVRHALERRAYVSVADEHSRKRLDAVGANCDINVAPDTAFLTPRLFTQPLLRRRRELHAVMGWLPIGNYIVVQADDLVVGAVPQFSLALQGVLDEHTELTVVVLSMGGACADEGFNEALGRYLPCPVSILPPLLAEDIASVIEGAQVIIATSAAACITALAYGRSCVLLNLDRRPEMTALAGQVESIAPQVADLRDLPTAFRRAFSTVPAARSLRDIEATIDHHFDELCSVIERRCETNSPTTPRATRRNAIVAAELHSLRRAHDIRGRQLVGERAALSSALERERTERASALETEHRANAHLRAHISATEAERDAAVSACAAERARADQAEAAFTAVYQTSLTHNEAIDQSLSVAAQANIAAVAAVDRANELRVQLRLTGAALDATHATKTLRLLRVPRRLYGLARKG